MKLAERGVVRADMEQLFLRQSRVPQTVGMDLHAALAGLTVARERILKLLERYGARTVKAVMRKTLDAGERAFLEKLEMIPDGRWSERIYTEAALPGDPGIYVSQVNITKEGDFLYVGNEGTSPQTGAINNTYAGFVGAVLAPLTLMLAYDLGGVCGGVSRRVKFHPVPGTITCADYPAPISGAGVYNMPMMVATATGAVAKMVACADAPLRDKAIGMADVHAYGGWIFNGINQHGQFFVGMSSGMAVGAVPASPGRDGVDTGGIFWVPGMEASNVEECETAWPVLTLYRRHNRANAAGAGRFRSGVAAEEAWILHGADSLDVQIYTNESYAKCQGLLGGNPGGRAFFRVKQGGDVRARLAAGHIPQSLDEVSGEEMPLYWKGAPVALDGGSVWTANLPNFAGYGDPLDRDPALVERDLAEAKTTPGEALEVYGVVTGEGARSMLRRPGPNGPRAGSSALRGARTAARPRPPRPARPRRTPRPPRAQRQRSRCGAHPGADHRESQPRPHGRGSALPLCVWAGPGRRRRGLQEWLRGERKPGRRHRRGVHVVRCGDDGQDAVPAVLLPSLRRASGDRSRSGRGRLSVGYRAAALSERKGRCC